jgi:hypothetical protein
MADGTITSTDELDAFLAQPSPGQTQISGSPPTSSTQVADDYNEPPPAPHPQSPLAGLGPETIKKIAHQTRALTAKEAQVIRNKFGDAVNPDDIRLGYDAGASGTNLRGYVLSKKLPTVEFYPTDMNDASDILHESTHVWQNLLNNRYTQMGERGDYEYGKGTKFQGAGEDQQAEMMKFGEPGAAEFVKSHPAGRPPLGDMAFLDSVRQRYGKEDAGLDPDIAARLHAMDPDAFSTVQWNGDHPRWRKNVEAELQKQQSGGIQTEADLDNFLGQQSSQQPAGKPAGMLEPGNINLYDRPHVLNPDGKISTVHSTSFEYDGKEVLVPTVQDDGTMLPATVKKDGKDVPNPVLVDEYVKTGKTLGVFDNADHATAYAQQLHNEYAAGKYDQITKPKTEADLDAFLGGQKRLAPAYYVAFPDKEPAQYLSPEEKTWVQKNYPQMPIYDQYQVEDAMKRMPKPQPGEPSGAGGTWDAQPFQDRLQSFRRYWGGVAPAPAQKYDPLSLYGTGKNFLANLPIAPGSAATLGGRLEEASELTRIKTGAMGDDILRQIHGTDINGHTMRASSKAVQLLEGAAMVPLDFVQSMSSADNLAMLAGMGPASGVEWSRRLVEYGFSAQLAAGAAEGIVHGIDSAKDGDLFNAMRSGGGAALSAFFAAHTMDSATTIKPEDWMRRAQKRVSRSELMQRAQDLAMNMPDIKYVPPERMQEVRQAVGSILQEKVAEHIENRPMRDPYTGFTESDAVPIEGMFKPGEHLTPAEREGRRFDYAVQQAREHATQARRMMLDEAAGRESGQRDIVDAIKSKLRDLDHAKAANDAEAQEKLNSELRDLRAIHYNDGLQELTRNAYGVYTRELQGIAEANYFDNLDQMKISLEQKKTRGRALNDTEKRALNLINERAKLGYTPPGETPVTAEPAKAAPVPAKTHEPIKAAEPVKTPEPIEEKRIAPTPDEKAVEPPAQPAAQSETPKTGASVKMFVSNKDVRDLRALGWSDEAINKMKPDVAQATIEGEIRPEPKDARPTPVEVPKEVVAKANIAQATKEDELRKSSKKLDTASQKAETPEAVNALKKASDDALQGAEIIRQQREGAARAMAAQESEPTEYPMGPPVRALEGRADQVVLHTGRKLDVHYAIVPLRDVIQSHDPYTFEWNDRYARPAQPRDYLTNKTKQLSVIQLGNDPDVRRLHTDNPSPDLGPPLIRNDGQALVNGRVMGQMRAYKEGQGERIYEDLKRAKQQFGIEGELPSIDEQPILVRILDHDVTDAQELRRLGVDTNEGQGYGYSEAEAAVKAAMSMTPDDMDWVANEMASLGDNPSPRDLMTKRQQQVIDLMHRTGLIPPNKLSEFVSEDREGVGSLTEHAKDVFEEALLGKVFGDVNFIKTLPKEIANKFWRSLGVLTRIKARADIWDIIDYLKEGTEVFKSATSISSELNLLGKKTDSIIDKYIRPENYENGSPNFFRQIPHPVVEALAKLLDGSSLNLKDSLDRYIKDAEKGDIKNQGGFDFYTPPTPWEAFNAVIGKQFGIEVKPEEWGSLQKASTETGVSEAQNSGEIKAEDIPAPPEPLKAPASETGDLKVGDHQKIMGVDSTLAKTETNDGMRYDLFTGQRASVRVVDVDSGKVATIKQYPTPEAAEADYADAVRVEKSQSQSNVQPPPGEINQSQIPVPPPKLEPVTTEADLRSKLSEIRNLKPEQVDAVTTTIKNFAKYKGIGLDQALNSYLAGIMVHQGEPDVSAALYQESSGGNPQRDTSLFEQSAQDLFGKKPSELSMSELSKVAMEAAKRAKAASEPLYQSDESPVWKMKSAEILDDPKMQNSASGDQWASLLRNKGVKSDEMKWIGLEDFLKDKKKVTKQELQQFIQENQLQVQEVAKSGQPDLDKVNGLERERNSIIGILERQGYSLDSADEGYNVFHNGKWATPDVDGGIPPGLPKDVREKLQRVIAIDNLRVDLIYRQQTKYGQYTLPGEKKNYTELLLTLPTEAPTLKSEQIGEVTWRELPKPDNPPAFYTSHFDEPNILAHVRLDERTDADGKRVLLIEEVQSDWHQKGKKQGYAATGEERKAVEKRLAEITAEQNKINAENPSNRINDFSAFEQLKKLEEEAKKLRDSLSAPPDAPFKTDWHEMAMKRMLRWAAEHGYDKLAWVTGEQTAARYDLTKHISSIQWDHNPDGTYGIVPRGLDGKKIPNLSRESVSAEELETIIGKDVAKKIVDADGHMGRLTGVDLKIGGEWAKNLYDKAIPNFMSKYGKKWGAKVGETEIETGSATDRVYKGPTATEDHLFKLSRRITDEPSYMPNPVEDQAEQVAIGMQGGMSFADAMDHYAGKELAEKLGGRFEFGKSKREKTHSVTITPEMRDSVMQGQTLFQGKKGATQFMEDGRAVIHAFQKADVSTVLHELFHVYRRNLHPTDMATMEKWLGVENGKWQRQHEEKAANAYEKYWFDGKAPTAELKPLFASIKQWMVGIYKQLAGKRINVRIPGEVRDIFDRMAKGEGPGEEGGIKPPPEAPKTVRGVPIERAKELAQMLAGKDFVGAAEKNESIQEFDKKIDPNNPPMRVKFEHATVYGTLSDAYSVRKNKNNWGQIEDIQPLRPDDPQHPNRIVYSLDEDHPSRIKFENRAEIKDLMGKDRSVVKDAQRSSKRDFMAKMTPERAESIRLATGLDPATFWSSVKSGKKLATAAQSELPIEEQSAPVPKSASGPRQQLVQIQPPPELPKAEPPKSYGEKNVLVKRDEYEAAKKLLNEKLNRLHSGLDPTIMAEATKMGLYHFEAGAREFGRWSKQMLDELGENFRPYVHEVWKRLKSEAILRANSQLRQGMDKRPVIEAMRDADKIDPYPVKTERRLIVTPDEARQEAIDRAKGITRVPAPPPLPDIERAGADATARSEDAEGTGSDNGQSPGPGSSPPERSPVRHVRPGGQGEQPRGTPRSVLTNTPAAALDTPRRQRGEPLYDPKEWAARLERLNLPKNAPVPFVKISDAVRRKLIFPGQPETAEMALSGLAEHDSFILATTTGTGKSYLSAGILAELKPKRALYLTKNQSLVDSMLTILPDWGIDAKKLPTGAVAPPGDGVWIATYATALQRKGIEQYPWDLVIKDEADAGRRWHDANAQTGDMLRTMDEYARQVLYMSATPFHNALEVGAMPKLGLWKDMGWDRWAEQFGIRYDDQRGGWTNPFNPRKLEKLREQLIQRGQMINMDRNMEGYHPHFGVVPLSAEGRQRLRDAVQAFSIAQDYYQGRGKSRMVMATIGNAKTYIKNLLERERLPEVIELAKKGLAQGHQVIIMTENKKEVNELFQFLEEPDQRSGGQISALMPKLAGVVEALQEEFGDKFANFSGKYSKERQQQMKDFNAGKKPIIFATYAAGGVGVSLHDADIKLADGTILKGGDRPRMVIYAGLPWSGIMLDQAIGRPWRYGTKSDVGAYFLLSNSKPEMQLVLQKVAPRLESLRAVVSGITNDPIVSAMRSIDGALDYMFGNEHKASAQDFLEEVNAKGVMSYSELPVADASEYRNKGMRYPGEDKIAEPPAAPQTMYQEGEDEETPEPPEVKQQNDVAAQKVEEGKVSQLPGGDDPQVQAAFARMDALDRGQLADSFREHADGAARETQGDALDKQAAVTSQWRQSMDWVKKSDAGVASKAANRYLMTHGYEIIRQIGDKAGREIADGMAPEYHIQSGTYGGDLAKDLMDIFKAHGLKFKPSEEFSHAWDVKEGKAQALNAGEQKFVDELTKWTNKARQMLADENVVLPAIEEGRRKLIPYKDIKEDPNYMPHHLPPDVFREGKARERVIQSIMDRDNISRKMAEDRLESMHRDRPLAGHIEKTREVNAGGYSKTPYDLFRYAREVGEAIARTKVFGQDRELLERKIMQIDHPKDRTTVRKIMDQLLAPKHVHRDASALTRFATNFVVITKMPFSALPAMSQTFKAGIYANNRAMLTALWHTMRDYQGSWHAALESGAILDAAWQKMMHEMGAGGVAQKALDLYGFNMAHYWGRVVADQTARVFMEKYALPHLQREPQSSYWNRIVKEKFGQSDASIQEALAKGKWSAEALDRAGKRNADVTQFNYTQPEIPPSWSIDPTLPPKSQFTEAFMHTMLLLQRTAFRNGVLIKDALIGEAKKGNWRPWLVFAAAVSVGDEVMGDLYDLMHGRLDRIKSLAHLTPKTLAIREMENLSFHGGLGMVKMLLEPIKYGVEPAETFAGPFFGQVLSFLKLVTMDIPKSKDFHKAWLKTWGFTRRSYPPLSVVQNLIGVPGETPKEERERLAREDKRKATRSGSSGGTRIRPAPR